MKNELFGLQTFALRAFPAVTRLTVQCWFQEVETCAWLRKLIGISETFERENYPRRSFWNVVDAETLTSAGDSS